MFGRDIDRFRWFFKFCYECFKCRFFCMNCPSQTPLGLYTINYNSSNGLWHGCLTHDESATFAAFSSNDTFYALVEADEVIDPSVTLHVSDSIRYTDSDPFAPSDPFTRSMTFFRSHDFTPPHDFTASHDFTPSHGVTRCDSHHPAYSLRRKI
jgi:hypothetical protein